MDSTIFIFLVLPLATIILAIVLQKILKSPILVALTFFAIYLIVAFASFSDTLAEALIATIIYTLIAYVTALIVMLICRCKRRFCTSATTNVSSQNALSPTNSLSDEVDTTSLLDITSKTSNQDIITCGEPRRRNLSRRMYRRF